MSLNYEQKVVEFLIKDNENCSTFFPSCEIIIQEDCKIKQNISENTSVELIRETFFLVSIFPYIQGKALFKFFRVYYSLYNFFVPLVNLYESFFKQKEKLEENPYIAERIAARHFVSKEIMQQIQFFNLNQMDIDSENEISQNESLFTEYNYICKNLKTKE